MKNSNKALERSNLLCNHLSRLLSGKIFQATINNFANLAVELDYARGLNLYKRFSQAVTRFAAIKHDKVSLYQFITNELGEICRVRQYKPVFEFSYQLSKLVESLSTSSADKVLTGLMALHSVYVPESKPSSNDLSLVRGSIGNANGLVPTHLKDEFRSTCKNFIMFLKGYLDCHDEKLPLKLVPLNEFPAVSSKKAYQPWAGKAVERRAASHFDLRKILTDKNVMDLYREDPKMFVFYTFGCWPESVDLGESPIEIKAYPYSGKISMLPSPKGKYRPIAVPSIVFLSLNYPLSILLKTIGRILPNHGAFDHDKAAREVQSRIDGKTEVYSVDYSSFTDYFPYELQRILLEELQKEKFISDFDLKVQDKIVSIPFKLWDKPVYYSRGTPQGTYTSFQLASLVHMLSGHMVNKRLTGKYSFGEEIPIVVVGDDAAIFGVEFFTEMRKVMMELGTPIQEDKTLISRDCVEFCSKFITKEGVYQMKKIKPIVGRDAHIKAYIYYDGNIKIPLKYKNILNMREPYGVLPPEMEDPVSDMFDLLSFINLQRREISSLLSEKDFRTYIRRGSIYKECFRQLEFNPSEIDIPRYFNPYISFIIGFKTNDADIGVRAFLEGLSDTIEKQISDGRIRYNEIPSWKVVQRHLARVIRYPQALDSLVFENIIQEGEAPAINEKSKKQEELFSFGK